MNRTLIRIVVGAGLLGLCGCASTTIQLDRVLTASGQKLKDNSPYGIKALRAMAALRQLQQAQDLVRVSLESIYEHQTKSEAFLLEQIHNVTNAEFTSAIATQRVALRLGLESRKRFLDALQTADQNVKNRLAIFEEFFQTNNAVGLAPRIDWEVLRTIAFLNRQKDWLSANQTNVQPLTSREDWTNLLYQIKGPAGRQASNALAELTRRVPSGFLKGVSEQAEGLELAVQTAGKDGFGGFRTIGVTEIDASDRAYRSILTSNSVPLSHDSFSKLKATTTGDATVIIVQESPTEFRLYQISNDPTTLMKNISLLVAKATAAAAKYLSGGISP